MRVEYGNTSKEQEAHLSERHEAMGNAILKGNTASHECSLEGEEQCLNDAFEKLCEGKVPVTYTTERSFI